ncbi:hypothetical protein GGI25_003137 [Coemansia spiralis]|uniref:SH3 domain-containing protein n=2 Tax=Coemansia TaxID=4863 RepID=A0A9W8G6K9_9FUNG|nr:hypothetical protein BX070DRAFT_237445 [Coemansia spiralis]KAJ1991747.1 hypothetical protein EDC05_003244 [Coemansia umbellata]KAJ2621748.1 hypothetical protein GGI26_003843 [Coemansia sp. RSA 1358]KAJ2677502.1 hypothetical protein GGI25_003137 [Coemansia spiralis]
MNVLRLTKFQQNYMRVAQRPRRNRNTHNLTVDTKFVIANMDFESTNKGILSIRCGDIIRVQHGGDAHPKWWVGTVVKSYYGSKGYGYFFPVLFEEYDFLDNRIASRIPMALLELHGKLRSLKKRHK